MTKAVRKKRQGNHTGRTVETANAFAVTERRRQVAELLKARVKYRDIAASLNVSLGTVAGDKLAIMQEWQELYAEHFHEGMLIDLATLDELILRLFALLEKEPGELTIIDRILHCLERRARMIGYDARDRRDIPIHFPQPVQTLDIESEVLTADGVPVGKGAAAKLYALFGTGPQLGEESNAAIEDRLCDAAIEAANGQSRPRR